MKCLGCGAENPESNRYCGHCGNALANGARIRENLTDGRYGPADPEYPDYPDEDEEIYWISHYNLWGIFMQARRSYMIQNGLAWTFFLFMMLIPILEYGLIGLVAVLNLVAFMRVVQYIFWKARRSAAEEFNQTK
jgi:hypothetical protein